MNDLKITGLAELDRALQDLPAKIERSVLRGGLRAGAKVIEAAARARVPAKSGALRESIRVSMRVRRGRVAARIIAGNKQAFYAHMVEFGTAHHWIKPRNRKSLFLAGLFRELVDHPGARQKPFMRPALDSSAGPAVDAMASYIRARLPSEFAKSGK